MRPLAISRACQSISFVLALIVLPVALMFTLAGCGPTITATLSPDQIQVTIDIKDYHQGTAPVAIRFANLQDNTIEFVHGETVTCDGIYLKYDSAFIAQWFGYGSYTGDVSRQPPDASYMFQYSPPQGSPVSMAVPVVNAPVTITSIASSGTVQIPTAGTPLVVSYQAGGFPNTTLYATATDSRSHTALAIAFNDPGTISFNGNDFSQFAPGPGLITVSRVTNEAISGTPFSKVTASYENIATLPVIWQ